jgi:hypothetical protein
MKWSSNLNREKATLEAVMTSLLLAMMIFTAIMIGFLPAVSEKGQTYNDLIYGFLPESGMNKSGELLLFWTALAIAALSQAIIYQLLTAGGGKKTVHADAGQTGSGGRDGSKDSSANAGRAARTDDPVRPDRPANVDRPAQDGRPDDKLHLSERIRRMRIFKTAKEHGGRLLLLSIFGYYSVTGLSLLFMRLTAGLFAVQVSKGFLWGAAALLVIGCIVIGKTAGNTYVDRIILGLQVLLPLNMLSYINDRYLYEGSVLIIRQSTGYYIAVFGLMLALFVVYFISINKSNRLPGETAAGQMILLSSVVSIFVFNSYFLPARVVSTDLWHTGEQVVAWQQAVQKGAVLYVDFSPPSGLHPLVTGAILNILLDGTASSYCAAIALQMAFTAVITIVLLYFVCEDKRLTLVLATLFGLTIYNRFYVLLPALLLLMLPKLAANRSAWCKAWILCCLAAGLYYPVYGVALLIGTLPFGIVQTAAFFRTGEYRQKIRRPLFWLGWIAALTPIILCVPLLIRMVRYILLVSSQSTLADGLALFVNNPGIGYLALRVSLPAVFVLAALLCLQIYLTHSDTRPAPRFLSPAFLGLSAIPAVLMVSYLFSLVRANEDVILSRTAGVLIPVGAMFFTVVLSNYGKQFMTAASWKALIGILLPIGLILILFGGWILSFPNASTSVAGIGGLRYDAEKITASNPVDGSYTLLTEERIAAVPRTGVGFMDTGNFDLLVGYADTIKKYGIEDENFVNMRRMFYYILNIRAPETDLTELMLSDKAQRALLEVYEADPPVVAHISSYNNYLVYRWMIENDYVRMEDGFYMPSSKIESLDLQEYSAGTGIEGAVTEWGTGYNLVINRLGPGQLQLTANSMGRSLDSLNWMFESRLDITENISQAAGVSQTGEEYTVTGTGDASVRIEFAAAIAGTDYDYLYLDIAASPSLSKTYDGSILTNFFTYYSTNTKMREYPMKLYWSGSDGLNTDEKMFLFYLGDGRILIPLGARPDWLLEQNESLTLVFPDNFAAGESFVIRKAELLRREVYLFE